MANLLDLTVVLHWIARSRRSADGGNKFLWINGFEQIIQCAVPKRPQGKLVVRGGENDFEAVLDLVEPAAENLLKTVLTQKGLINCGC